MKNIILIGLLGGILAGCSSTPVPNDLAVNVPEERVYNLELLTKKEGTGTVIIKRDKGFVGGACPDSIFVDGVKITDLYATEKIVIYLQPGKTIFSMKPNNPCGGGLSEIEGSVEENQIVTYRIFHSYTGENGIYRTAF